MRDNKIVIIFVLLLLACHCKELCSLDCGGTGRGKCVSEPEPHCRCLAGWSGVDCNNVCESKDCSVDSVRISRSLQQAEAQEAELKLPQYFIPLVAALGGIFVVLGAVGILVMRRKKKSAQPLKDQSTQADYGTISPAE